MNKRNSNRSKITTVTDLSGNDVIDNTDIANVFNDYFAYVGIESNHHTPPLRYRNVPKLNYIHVNVHDVVTAISKLKIIYLLVRTAYLPYFLSELNMSWLFPLLLCSHSCYLLLVFLEYGRKL